MKKKIVAIVLSVLMLFFVTDTTAITADAASKFNGSKFGAGFDSHDWGTFEVANGWSNGGMFNCTWRDANVWFSGGKLYLKIDRDTDGSGYSGGEYRTKQTFGYGMYDVSMKPIKNSGVVTSFFTYTGPSDGTVWDEIDIEFLGKDTTKVQFNYYTKGVGNHEHIHNLGFDAAYAFHQYGFYWGPGYITWYVDGKAVYTATNNIPTTPGKIMLNVWPGTGVDAWLGRYDGRTPLVAEYDWISYTAPGSGSTTTNNNNNNNSNNNNSGNVSFNSSTQYKIISKKSGKALDVAYGRSDNGTNILQYRYNGYGNQKWYIQKNNEGYYVIKNVQTGKVVDVEARSTADGGNILQWQNNGGWNQQWKIEKVGDAYRFRNRHSGKILDVEGASTADNANVCQWRENGGMNQLWYISNAY